MTAKEALEKISETNGYKISKMYIKEKSDIYFLLLGLSNVPLLIKSLCNSSQGDVYDDVLSQLNMYLASVLK